MVQRMAHWFTGWVRFEITGEPGRFLTLAARRGVGLWGIRRREEGGQACCRPGAYCFLREPARRCGVQVRLLDKGGLPLQAGRWKKRPGLLAGIPLAAGLVWFLGGFVWGVSVTGSQTLGDGVIREAAARCGVTVGAPRDSFVPKEAAHAMVARLPELEWASVNTDGCFVELAVREAAPKPRPVEQEGVSNIVASRAGTVVAVEAQSGRPEVQTGQTVEAGELLIAGAYRERLDPWSPRKEAYEQAGRARGSVTARTYREFTVYVSANKEEALPGEPCRRVTLELLGLRAPGNLFFPPEGECTAVTKRFPLVLLGVELPAAVEVETVTPVTRQTRVRTREELQRDALWKLRRAQRAALPQGARVESEALEWAFSGEGCVLTARCRCLEEIGLEQVTLAKQPENDGEF